MRSGKLRRKSMKQAQNSFTSMIDIQIHAMQCPRGPCYQVHLMCPILYYLKCRLARLELWPYRCRWFRTGRCDLFFFFFFLCFFPRFVMFVISFFMALGMGWIATARTVNRMSMFWRRFRGIARKGFLWLSQNVTLNRRLVSISSLYRQRKLG